MSDTITTYYLPDDQTISNQGNRTLFSISADGVFSLGDGVTHSEAATAFNEQCNAKYQAAIRERDEVNLLMLDVKADKDALRAALREIFNVGPLGVDTYAVCWKRMHDIADKALHDEPHAPRSGTRGGRSDNLGNCYRCSLRAVLHCGRTGFRRHYHRCRMAEARNAGVGMIPRDDVLRMAREADDAVPNEAWHTAKINRKSNAVQMIPDDFLVAFAALVAAEEREACAKVCDEAERNYLEDDEHDDFAWDAANVCAAAIRARAVDQPSPAL